MQKRRRVSGYECHMSPIERIRAIPIAYPDPNDFHTTRRTVLVEVIT